jgi:reactive chlorine resistance protein C
MTAHELARVPGVGESIRAAVRGDVPACSLEASDCACHRTSKPLHTPCRAGRCCIFDTIGYHNATYDRYEYRPLWNDSFVKANGKTSQNGVPMAATATPREMTLPEVGAIRRVYLAASSLDRFGMGLLRLALVIVLVWIGGLKFARYEAESIVPLVANSPVMSFLYHHPAPEYRSYMNKEGELVPAHRQWHETNGTYPVSYGLGIVIISIGILIALHPFLPQVAAIGSFLLILMACTTLSFLITTPEAWVTPGFPFLSGAGRLIIKDTIMLGAAVVTLADSARTYVRRTKASVL